MKIESVKEEGVVMAYMNGTYGSDAIADDVDINPFYTFILLFITPYVLFFAILMLITGQTDIELLYYSVMNESDTAVIKAWVIGSFVLSVLGTLFFSGYRTTDYIARRIRAGREEISGGSVLPVEPDHFVIEEVAHDEETEPEEETPRSPERYARLDGVIGDTKG